MLEAMSTARPPQASAEHPSPAPGTPPAHAPRPRRRLLLLLTLLGLVAAFDAVFIEPYRIEVTHHQVSAPLEQPLKIAHLTDVHTRGFGRLERRVLELLDAEKPDLIVVTGDTVAGSGNYAAVHEFLLHLHAPLGVWVVLGNRENAYPLKGERGFYASAKVNFLHNEARPARPDVWIAGLDDVTSGRPDLEAALRNIPPGAYTIALFHAPVYFDRVAGRCPLALAGHTHGGQVRLPLVPPVWLPRGSGRYIEGWFEKGGSRLYVSRGIGTSILPVRFLCRPELAILTLQK